MKPVAEYRDRVQLIIRLPYDDFQKLKTKTHADQLKTQHLMHKLITEYLRDNRHIMKMLEPIERMKDTRRRIKDNEMRQIEDQIELESPLQDIVISDKSK